MSRPSVRSIWSTARSRWSILCVSNRRARVMASTTASAGNPLESVWAHAAYAFGVAALALALPSEAYSQSAGHFFVLLGLIGTWRYGWGILHFTRSIIYRRYAYPRLRAEAEAAYAGTRPPRA